MGCIDLYEVFLKQQSAIEKKHNKQKKNTSKIVEDATSSDDADSIDLNTYMNKTIDEF